MKRLLKSMNREMVVSIIKYNDDGTVKICRTNCTYCKGKGHHKLGTKCGCRRDVHWIDLMTNEWTEAYNPFNDLLNKDYPPCR